MSPLTGSSHSHPGAGDSRATARVPLPARPHRTFPGRLDGDLLADVAAAGGGDGSHPQQVLLPAAQVGDAVEELVGAGLVLAGGLEGEREKLKPL